MIFLKRRENFQNKKSKFNWITFIDILAVLVIALIAYFPLANPGLTNLVSLIGALIVISRFVLQSLTESKINQLKEEMELRLLPLEQVQNYIDLSQESHISDIDSLLKLYSSINEKEFKAVKDAVLTDAFDKLHKLATQKMSDELTSSEYYEWLLPMLDDIPPKEHLRAVSIMNAAEWDESVAEQQFFQKHIEAAKRGVIIERVFIMNEDMLQAALSNEAVKAHTLEIENGIKGFIASRKWLEEHDAKLLEQAGHGFIIIGDRVALVDNFSSSGEVRGYVVMNNIQITRLITTFKRLLVNAKPFSQNLLVGNQPKQLPPLSS